METLEKAKQEQKTSGKHETKTVAGVEYWTSKKAARYLGISKVSLHTYARQKLITQLNFGGFILFKQEWLDEFINEKTTNGYANKPTK